MKRKKEKVPQEKKLFSNKQLIIAAVLVATIALGFLLSAFLLQTREVKFSSKAAIIDQLGKDFPNTEFNETVASLLENNGFNVSYHRSESVNVTFYKELAKYNYGIIILRAHSALRKGETIVDFFTSEEYSEDKYVSEQDNGLLTRGYYSWEPNKFYFAVTPKFIENLEGSFPKSIIIAMGCNSLNETCIEMANAFINKGAKAYIGWTGLVDSSHTDSETIKLLRRLLDENQTITDAVSKASPDWQYYPPSEMKYYPLSAGNLKISDLMAEAKAIATLQSTFCNFEKGFLIYITNVARFIKLS
jgi:hypothetical protein